MLDPPEGLESGNQEILRYRRPSANLSIGVAVAGEEFGTAADVFIAPHCTDPTYDRVELPAAPFAWAMGLAVQECVAASPSARLMKGFRGHVLGQGPCESYPLHQGILSMRARARLLSRRILAI